MGLMDSAAKAAGQVGRAVSAGAGYVNKQYKATQYTTRVLCTVDDVVDALDAPRDGYRIAGTFFAPEEDIDPRVHATEVLSNSILFGTYSNETGELVATARLLWRPDMTIDDTRVPTDKLTAEAAEATYALPAGTIADVQYGAVRQPVARAAAMQLLTTMVRYSRDHGITHWVSAIRPATYNQAIKYVDSAMVKLTDHPVTYPGVDVPLNPIMIELNSSLTTTITKHATRVTGRAIANGGKTVGQAAQNVRTPRNGNNAGA